MGAHDQGTDSATTAGRWLSVTRTLCFVTHGQDVLLIKRADTRRIFPGRYNGVGGHLERNEDPLTCAIREIQEETGLNVSPANVRLRGVSHIDAGGPTGIVLFIFTVPVESREGTLTECHEGTLHWIPIDRALKLPLVEDLPIVWPRLFGAAQSETPFFAHVAYDATDRLVMRFAHT
ncbi:MAG: NUDIX hydrolase [Aggregatilineales bacterium]